MSLQSVFGISFITSPGDLVGALAVRYDAWTVSLSVLIVMFTSACAFEMAARMERNRAMVWWLPPVAGLQGAGIWAMHFIGMQAFRLDCAVSYDPTMTALSVLPGIVASGSALYLDAQSSARMRTVLFASAILAAGIGAMHYMGMHAMQLDGLVLYDPAWFLLSLGCVFCFAYAALVLRRRLRKQVRTRPALASVAGGVVMGGATAGMHYISMAGAHFVTLLPGAMPPDPLATNPATLASVVAGVTLVLVLGGLGFTTGVSKLDSMRQRVDLVLACSSQGFATFNAQGVVDRCNPALARMLACTPEDMLGRTVQSLFPAEDVPRLRGSYKIQTRLRRADGSELVCMVHGDEAFDADRTVLYTFAWFEDIAERDAAEQALRRAHSAAREAGEQVRTLLDNSGQGFLVINETLQVEGNFSLACERILGASIQGADITERLIPQGFFDDDDAREPLRRNLLRVFQTADQPVRQAAYLGLLPESVCLDGRTYQLQHRWLASRRLMLILTDISETVALQESVRREHKRVEYFINAIENRSELLKTIETWRHFMAHTLPEILGQTPAPPSLLADIRRQIHTFKGLFSQDSFPGTPVALHRLESALAALPDHPPQWAGGITAAIDQAGLEDCLQQDLALLSEQLGLDLSTTERTTEVPLRALHETGLELARLSHGGQVPAECLAPLRTSLQRLALRPLSRLLEPHFTAAQSLAPQLGKQLAPIRPEGDQAFVDEARWTGFVDALVHVFRNCVDHGIEPPALRADIGKDPQARIACHIEADQHRLTLTISDDGQGMDPERIRAAALRRRITDEQQLKAMAHDDLLHLIFADQFTTRDEVNTISGRGIGLAAVRQAALALGGEVRVHSLPGEGSRFQFTVPLMHPEYIRTKTKEVLHAH